ncbi:MAG: transglycosylase SLT domain-containing protein [Caldilineaceae bacterium]|nr:transglycosylase SLT domain-containing protein [Caldilineaceae bacterium]
MADEPVEDTPKHRPRIEMIVPPPLRNWQVVEQTTAPPPLEIDGEATVVAKTVISETVISETGATPVATDASTTPPATAAAPDPETLQPHTLDQLDEQIIVLVEQRAEKIEAGTTVTYSLTLRNNGPERALFTIELGEQRPGLWLAEPLPSVMIEPGARETVAIALAPPRSPVSRAGDYLFTVRVRADAYPERQSQVGLLLTITPFVALTLGKVVAPQRTLTWWRRSLFVTVPLTNHGNHPVTVALRAQAGAGACQVAFQASGLRQVRPQQALVTIPAGRMTPVSLQVYAQSQGWFGRTKRLAPLQLTATAKAMPRVEQHALVKIALAPVIGPWQVAALAGLFSLIVTGMGVGGLAVLIAVMVNMAQPTLAVPSPATAAPSLVTILVQQAPLGPQQSAPQNQPGQGIAGPAVVAVGPQPSAEDALLEERNLAVPLVQPEQVSSPGRSASTTTAAVTAAPQAALPEPSVTAATARTMTYAQMFQEVALRYDLNWRMLAAQAYLESSFDSLALGSHGDLGLMQIQPLTWREWAPVVEVSDPFDSYSNALVAAVYSDYLRTLLGKRGHPEQEWMLLAYNWGPDKVLQHLENGGTWADLAPERRQYVEDVLRLAETIPLDAAF